LSNATELVPCYGDSMLPEGHPLREQAERACCESYLVAANESGSGALALHTTESRLCHHTGFGSLPAPKHPTTSKSAATVGVASD
jgi:hypothetical protein